MQSFPSSEGRTDIKLVLCRKIIAIRMVIFGCPGRNVHEPADWTGLTPLFAGLGGLASLKHYHFDGVKTIAHCFRLPISATKQRHRRSGFWPRGITQAMAPSPAVPLASTICLTSSRVRMCLDFSNVFRLNEVCCAKPKVPAVTYLRQPQGRIAIRGATRRVS